MQTETESTNANIFLQNFLKFRNFLKKWKLKWNQSTDYFCQKLMTTLLKKLFSSEGKWRKSRESSKFITWILPFDIFFQLVFNKIASPEKVKPIEKMETKIEDENDDAILHIQPDVNIKIENDTLENKTMVNLDESVKKEQKVDLERFVRDAKLLDPEILSATIGPILNSKQSLWDVLVHKMK